MLTRIGQNRLRVSDEVLPSGIASHQPERATFLEPAMKQIPLTQGKFALVDDEDYEWLMQWKWYAANLGRSWYAARWRRKVDGPGPVMIFMHRVILGVAQNRQADHINGNGLDNRRFNLRPATSSMNSCNRRPIRLRKDKLPIGVYPQLKRFRARFRPKGCDINLGVYDNPEDAKRAYDAACAEFMAQQARET